MYLENNFVRYKAYDGNGRTVITYDYNISTFQNWAFYLDEKKNFWVFSSDIGDSVWKKGNGHLELRASIEFIWLAFVFAS